MEKRHLWWHEMSLPEIQERAEKCDIAMLPIGAIEQHGPHCPAGSDALNAIGIAELVAKKTGIMLLPCPMYGSHPYHHWYMPGTIPLSYDTHIAMIVDIINGAKISGFNKFLILSAHGQVSTTLVAVHKLGLQGHFVLSIHWYDFVRDNQDVMEMPMWHADESETSLALYLYPQYVDMSKADKGSGEPLIDRRFIIAPGMAPKPGQMYHFEGTFARPEYKELTNGIIGDATLATREKGVRIVTRVVDYVAEIVEDIRGRYPVGVTPPVK